MTHEEINQDKGLMLSAMALGIALILAVSVFAYLDLNNKVTGIASDVNSLLPVKRVQAPQQPRPVVQSPAKKIDTNKADVNLVKK